MIKKILRHIYSGTLLRAVQRNIRKKFLKIDVPIGDEYYGEKANNYLNHRSNEEFWILEEEALESELSNYRGKEKLLDIPFGTGRFMEIYQKKNFIVTGVDSSVDMLNVARELHDKNLHDSTLKIESSTNLSFDNESFDLLVCFRFLPWVISYGDVLISLNEFQRVLKANGHAFLEFSVSRDKNTSSEIKNLDKNSIIWDRLSIDDIKTMLLRFNLKTEKTKFIHDDPENPNVTLFCCKKITSG